MNERKKPGIIFAGQSATVARESLCIALQGLENCRMSCDGLKCFSSFSSDPK